MTRLRTALSWLMVVPAILHGQAPSADRSVVVSFDNDLIGLRGAGPPPDYDYTHGMTVAGAWAGAPGFVRRVLGGKRDCRSAEARRAGCVVTALAVGQRIYTPRRDGPEPIAGERPYAGWLYGAATVRIVSQSSTRSLSTEVGVTGPPSLAEPVQKGVHRLLHNEAQRGWAHQLAAAPGFALRYDEVRRSDRDVGGTGIGALALRWGAVAGTNVTALAAGAEGTIGLRAALPWSPAQPDVARPARVHVLAGYRQEAMLRNVFVEGHGGSGRADARSFVGQAEVGVGYRWRIAALEYRHVVRGREYSAQPSPHSYGSIALAIHGF